MSNLHSKFKLFKPPQIILPSEDTGRTSPSTHPLTKDQSKPSLFKQIKEHLVNMNQTIRSAVSLSLSKKNSDICNETMSVMKNRIPAKRKMIQTALAVIMLTCLAVLPTYAQGGQKEAEALNSIGLFAGSDKGFELERTPTRAEALVMLLKLTGQAQTALDSNLSHPFTDSGWASAFIGYGYSNGYTSGVSATEFGTAHPATSQQYSVFLLRALGYTINEDYTYEKALPFFLSHAPALTPADTFTRGDMAAMSLSALAAPMKDGSGTLAENLSNQGLFSMEDYKAARDGAITEEKADVTVLMYMVGSDLESKKGLATEDIMEMWGAELNDSVNVVLQTGGTKKWKNNWMTAGATQRFQVTDDNIVHLSTLEDALMSTPDTLANFLRWGITAYPAQRYILVFWNHGEGTINGFGIDEINDGKTLSLGEMSRAFDWADGHFDLVAFDACLMATLTNAYMLRDHGDYLLASEEAMSLSGFSYAKWLNVLSKNPNISIKELSRQITNDYLDNSGSEKWSEVTLSLVDLSKIELVMREWIAVLSQLSDKLKLGRYADLDKAISDTKDYGIGVSYDQFDLIDYLEQLDTCGLISSDVLQTSVKQAVVHVGSSNIDTANGLAVYIPYLKGEQYRNATRASLLECGFTESELIFFDRFIEKKAAAN